MIQTPMRSLSGSRFFVVIRLASAAGALLAGGCAVTLEDGYKPHAIDSTPEARRSYYASPFTDDANGGGKQQGGPRFGPG